MKIFISQINPTIGDMEKNSHKILRSLEKAKREKAELFIAPELSISGYPPEDFLYYDSFLEENERFLKKILPFSEDILIVLGTIRREKGLLYNSAALIYDKKILEYKDKNILLKEDIFNEEKYFSQNLKKKIFFHKNKKIGILIGEEIFTDELTEDLGKQKLDFTINISAFSYFWKNIFLRQKQYLFAIKKLKSPLITCNQVGANDELVFDGYSMVFNKKGEIIRMGKGFVEEEMMTDLKEDPINISIDPMEDLYKALVLGVRDYFQKQNLQKACIGLSGGVDSALTACIAQDALGPCNILSLRMPSRFSSMESLEDAKILSENLRIEMKDIPIDGMFQNFLDLFSPFFYGKEMDTAEENIQARIRGMILMGISNKLGYIVLSTGNKSEMATGYMTLYGDMCGGLAVLSDVTKTFVYKLANWVNREKEIIPKRIIEKMPSAELKKDQKDQDVLPDYDLVDLILTEYVENHLSIKQIEKKHKIDKSIIQELVERIHIAEYKRRQGPIGIKVSKTSFSRGRFFPIVQGWI